MADTAKDGARLASLAEVRLGYSIRTRGASLTEGPVRVIQPRSLESGPLINVRNTDFADPGNSEARHLLHNDDLIFRTRGSRFEAAIYLDDGVPTVAAAPLVVVRIRHRGLCAPYLAWYLNNDPTARRHIERNSSGAAVATLSLSAIASIPIPVPPTEVQDKILVAARLVARQQEILLRLHDLVATHGKEVLGQVAWQRNQEEKPCP